MAEVAVDETSTPEPPQPGDVALVVEVCVFSLVGDDLGVVVVNQTNAPPGSLCLPRATLERGESLDDATGRVIFEQVHLDPAHHRRFMVNPPTDRISAETFALAAMTFVQTTELSLAPGAGAERAFLAPVDDVIANRSNNVVHDTSRTVTRSRHLAADLATTVPIATSLLSDRFTISDLRHVYELFSPGIELDEANFSRQVLRTQGFIEPAGRLPGPVTNENPQDRRPGTRGRPGRIFTSGSAEVLRPPIRLSNVSHAS